VIFCLGANWYNWKTTNQSQYVAAVSKQENALILLQLQGEGNDPVKAAHEFLSGAGTPVQERRLVCHQFQRLSHLVCPERLGDFLPGR
jgi:hypothetical protein